MKKCPYCGKSNDDRTNVCEHCYAAIPHEEEQKKPEMTEETDKVARSSRRKIRS